MSIFNIGNDIASIKGAIGNLTDFGDSPAQLFSLDNPNLSRAIAEINDTLWNQNPGYAFSVTTKKDPFTSVSSFADFKFQINPSSIRQDEDFSIMARPTQTGVIVEHEGFVFKRITIAGTTGINPKRGYDGYHEFGMLINYIRAYAEYKADPVNSDARLVFKNYKDNEFWFVEPTRFSKNRDASKPFMSQYEIQLLVIGKAAREPSEIETWFNNIHTYIDQYILGPLNDVESIINSSTDIIRQIEGEVDSIITDPLNEITETIDAINTGITTISTLPRRFYENFRDDVIDVENSLADLFGYNSSGYDSFYSRTAVSADLPSPPTIPPSDQVELLEAFITLENVLDRILATDELFESPTTDRNVTIESYFDNKVTIPVPTSVKEIIINRGDTLERIASRELGSSDRVLEIITLNNLEAPFIETEGTSTNYRVKNPGEKLLIPTYSALQTNTSQIHSKTSVFNSGLSVQDKFFGTDLKLSADFDLIFNNRNDYEYVWGKENAMQAVVIKVNLEKGGLPVNPELGISAGIGEKAKSSAAEIVTDLRTTILQDARFASISNLSVQRDGGQLTMNINVVPVNVGQPIPIRIALE